MKFRDHFNATLFLYFVNVNFKLGITELYPRISGEPVADPQHTLGTADLVYTF
jgi:hypothetical protein